MAVDEALLKSASDNGQITLRLYEWAEPTLSLGYFQKSADRALHSASLDCAMVRRSSGGGAILHDRELTYSLSLPGTNRWSSKQNDLYGTVHKSLVDFLDKSGVAANQFAFPQASLEAGEEADFSRSAAGNRDRFLCFERRTSGDIVLGEFKIGGSAQRRLSGATLQHGSLLMNRSEWAPELPGITDLVDIDIAKSEFMDGIISSLAAGLSFSLKTTSLSDEQKNNAEIIFNEKYGNTVWTCKR